MLVYPNIAILYKRIAKTMFHASVQCSNLNPIPHGLWEIRYHTGGTQCARTRRWSCVTPLRTLQISSYFMTLFLLTFPRTPWGHFSKKFLKILKTQKKWIFRFETKGSPLWIKIGKISKFVGFFQKIIPFHPESEFYMF